MSVTTIQGPAMRELVATHPAPASTIMSPPATVRWLGEPGGDELPLVGGKAANLSRLAATQRVPPGFTLTTRAFEAALAEPTRDGALRAPAGLRSEIAAAYAELSRRAGSPAAGVAVRSSASTRPT